jgi:hypothetical protein
MSRALAGGRDVQRDLLPAVEKEILHHDIFRELHETGLLAGLTFFGGTNLRLCHVSQRLSEDLDFKGGRAFNPGGMEPLASVSVEDPKPTAGNTTTWVAFRKRLQSRDLWDLVWLRSRLPDASPFHLDEKIIEHGRTPAKFLSRLDAAVGRLKVDPEARVTFMAELSRFLPGSLYETASNPDFWIYSVQSLAEDFERCEQHPLECAQDPSLGAVEHEVLSVDPGAVVLVSVPEVRDAAVDHRLGLQPRPVGEDPLAGSRAQPSERLGRLLQAADGMK